MTMLVLAVFLLAVYGLANAIAVLKIGCYIFGDPVDELVLKSGEKIRWTVRHATGLGFDTEDSCGRKNSVGMEQVKEIRRRRGLGRIPYIGDLFYCPACLSFWIGMAASVWFFSPASQVCHVPWKATLLDGLMASAASWLFHMAAMKLGQGVEDA